MSTTLPTLHSIDTLTSLIQRLVETFALKSIELDPLLIQSPETAILSIQELEAKLNLFAELIHHAGNHTLTEAQKTIGLHEGFHVRILALESLSKLYGDPSIGASFNPSTSTMTLSATSHDGNPLGCATHFAHEWAHALDYHLAQATGSKNIVTPVKQVGEHIEAVVNALYEHSETPFQGAVGALLRELADQEISKITPLSAQTEWNLTALSPYSPPAKKVIQSFQKLSNRLHPRIVSDISKTERKELLAHSKQQSEFLKNAVKECALLCCEKDARLKALLTTIAAKDRFASFCARVTLESAKQEASARRGRAKAFLTAQEDIAILLQKSYKQTEELAQQISHAIFHISPIKIERAGDDFFAGPYTGRSHWDAPGSLADLSCAMIRALRNDKALRNSELSKEKIVPLSYWWTLRREVTLVAGDVAKKAEAFIEFAHEQGIAPHTQASSALAWAHQKGVYAPGAALFFDLSATGNHMLKREAALNKQSLSEGQLKSLRSELSAPAKLLGSRKASIEGIAESIEQLFVSLATRPHTDPLSSIAIAGLSCGLVDNDEDETQDALDPARGWINSKSDQFKRNEADWLSLFSNLPRALLMFKQAVILENVKPQIIKSKESRSPQALPSNQLKNKKNNRL